MIATAASAPVLEAARIAYVTADEAHTLLRTALDRLLALIETLGPDDWKRPTACTAWNVRDMVAHQAGGYASGTGYREMLRQYSSLPKTGQLPEDAINELQLRERATATPAELIAELRRVGPAAIQNWAYGFRSIKPITVPHPVGGWLSVRHLMWVIHSRDTWMHRLDICLAAGRAFEQTPQHDGRIVALVMRDVDLRLRDRLGGRGIVFELSGVAGGMWKAGLGEAAATIAMDALDFNIYASRRSSYAEAREQARFSGDSALAERALRETLALY